MDAAKFAKALGGGRNHADFQEQLRTDNVSKLEMAAKHSFNAQPLSESECCSLITRIIYRLNLGETFKEEQMTQILFSMTKLFQNNNSRLRRLAYLLFKFIAQYTETAWMMQQQIVKEITGGRNACYRANAIRALAYVIDASQLASLDRTVRNSINKEEGFVSSAALLIGLRFSQTDVVKRWVNDVQPAVDSRQDMVQYHALALMYELKKADRNNLLKMIQSLRGKTQSNMSSVLLIRYIARCLREVDLGPEDRHAMFEYVGVCIRHKSDMVSYEAAKTLIDLAISHHRNNIPFEAGEYLKGAASTLQVLAMAGKPVNRFAAVRTLKRLADIRPDMVEKFTTDIEALLTDPNRSVVMFAVSTMLKVVREEQVERLIKQLGDITGDGDATNSSTQREVVAAVKELCMRYHKKHVVLMNFLSTNLREEGSIEFKRDLSDAMIECLQKVPGAKEHGLLQLCEFIEDCEFPSVCVRILGLLGAEVPKTQNPGKYVRFIYNRLILENALVRGAAVDALTKIAAQCEPLRKDIGVLLGVGKNDNDDEVRDRVHMYTKIIREDKPFGSTMDVVLPFAVDALYDALEFQLRGEGQKDAPINFSNLPTEEAYQSMQAAKQPSVESVEKNTKTKTADAEIKKSQEEANKHHQQMMETLSAIAGGEVGQLQHTCHKVALTEAEAEYHVSCVKHIFSEHIAMEFIVTNTIEDMTLTDIRVQLEPDNPGAAQLGHLGDAHIEELSHGQSASCYSVFQKSEAAPIATWKATLVFVDDGAEDDYVLEPLELGRGDYINPYVLPPGQFSTKWESMSDGASGTTQGGLPVPSLPEAVHSLINLMHMGPCDNTNQVPPDGVKCVLQLAGTYIGGYQVLVMAQVGAMQGQCKFRMQIRAQHRGANQDAEANQAVVQAVINSCQ